MRDKKLSLFDLEDNLTSTGMEKAESLFKEGKFHPAMRNFLALSRRGKLDPHTRAVCCEGIAKCELALSSNLKSNKRIRKAIKAYDQAGKFEKGARDSDYHKIAQYSAKKADLYLALGGKEKQAADDFQWAISNETQIENAKRDYKALASWCEKCGDCLIKIKSWENAKKFFEQAIMNEKSIGKKFNTIALDRYDLKIKSCMEHL